MNYGDIGKKSANALITDHELFKSIGPIDKHLYKLKIVNRAKPIIKEGYTNLYIENGNVGISINTNN
jgi:hypothetical protein